MSTYPHVELDGHDYFILPCELLEGVSTTDPPDGLYAAWLEDWWDPPARMSEAAWLEREAEIEAELAAAVIPVDERTASMIAAGKRSVLRLLPGFFVIVEYRSAFGVWVILYEIFFPDVDDARRWLIEEAPTPDPLGSYIIEVVFDQNMPLALRLAGADRRRPQ
jgi:hypothetical protein